MTRLEFDSIEFSFGERRLLNSVYMRCEPGKITGRSEEQLVFLGYLSPR
jgi:hypothetical protein